MDVWWENPNTRKHVCAKIDAWRETGTILVDKICAIASGRDVSTVIDYRKMVASEHSPLYSQIFVIRMRDVPRFVTTHYKTHWVGQSCQVTQTAREDLQDSLNGDRWEPCDHIAVVNAVWLISTSRKRLCLNSHMITRWVQMAIRDSLNAVGEHEIADAMVKPCVYRGGICSEVFKPCGYNLTADCAYAISDYVERMGLTIGEVKYD